MIGAGLALYKPRRRGGAGGGGGDFWSSGMNLYFNQADFDAAPGTSKQLGNAAALVSWGIVDAGSINGTYFDAAGVMQTKTAGTAPRLDYVGGVLDSLLSEAASTNLCPYCTQVGGTGWSVGGVAVTNSFQAAGSAPDGVTSWTNTSFSGGSPDDRLYNAAATVVDAAPHTLSLYVYADAPSNVRLGWYDTDLRYSADIAVGTGISRISWSSVASGTTLYPYVANRAAGGVNGGLHFWGMQLEARAPVATSLILNHGAILNTRTVCNITQSTLSIPGFTIGEGTWAARFKQLNRYGFNSRLLCYVGNNFSPMVTFNDTTVSIYNASGPQSVHSNVINNAAGAAIALTLLTTSGKISGGGGIPNSGTIDSNVATTIVKYGNLDNGSQPFSGNIYRLSYVKTIASDQQLQNISSGLL